MRKAAALALAAVALATGAAAAPPAHAASKICVALVVDFRALGGNVETACATVTSGSTGYDVLGAAGHRLGFRSDGLVCTVDGLPREGCSATDGTHYWAYWHRQPGSSSWEYSDSGGGSYQPRDKSTEGWVWQNGGSTGSAQPANVAYTTICKPTPSPTPARTTTAAAPRTTTAPRTAAAAPPPRAAATSATTATRTTAATAAPTRSATPAATPSQTPTADAATSPGTPDPDVSLQARSDGGGDGGGDGGSGGGVPVAPVVGLMVVGGVAVAAGLRFRRGGRGAG